MHLPIPVIWYWDACTCSFFALCCVIRPDTPITEEPAEVEEGPLGATEQLIKVRGPSLTMNSPRQRILAKKAANGVSQWPLTLLVMVSLWYGTRD